MDWTETSIGFRRHLLSRGRSDETVRTYVSNLRIFHQWATDHEVSPDEADCAVYVLFHESQIQAGLAHNTVRNRLHAARAYYNWLGVTPNPTDDIAVTRSKTMPKRPVPVADQRRIVYGARSMRDEAMWRTMIDTGIRIGELASMRVENIDWANNLVLINGKGSKQREVWISDETLAITREYLGGRRRGFVWLTKDGKPMTRDRARQNFDRLTVRQRVTAHPHQLRATFANEFLKAGGDLGALRVAMGHSDITTTAHYAAGTENERALTMMKSLNLSGRLL